MMMITAETAVLNVTNRSGTGSLRMTELGNRSAHPKKPEDFRERWSTRIPCVAALHRPCWRKLLVLAVVFYFVEVAPRAFNQSVEVELGSQSRINVFDSEIAAERSYAIKATEDPFFAEDLRSYKQTCDEQLGTTGTPVPDLHPGVFVVSVVPNDPKAVCIREGDTASLKNVTINAADIRVVPRNPTAQGSSTSTEWEWWMKLNIQD